MKREVKTEHKQNHNRVGGGGGEIPTTMGITSLYAESHFFTWSCILLCLISKLLTQDLRLLVLQSHSPCVILVNEATLSAAERREARKKKCKKKSK